MKKWLVEKINFQINFLASSVGIKHIFTNC